MRKILCLLLLNTAIYANYSTIMDRSGDFLDINAIDRGQATVCSSTTATEKFALQTYTVGGSTTSYAYLRVFASSAAFATEGGLYPGTTYWKYFQTNTNTMAKAKAYWAAKTTTAGSEGGIVITIPGTGYEDASPSWLVALDSAGCLGVANTKTLAVSSTTALCYNIPAVTGKQIVLTALSCNVTFASGATWITIYDGDSNTDTRICKEAIVTATNTGLKVSPVINTKGNAMRIQILAEVEMTAGDLNITYYYR